MLTYAITLMLMVAQPVVAETVRSSEAYCVQLLWAICVYTERCEVSPETRFSWVMCLETLTGRGRWGGHTTCERIVDWPDEMRACTEALLVPDCSWPVKECGS